MMLNVTSSIRDLTVMGPSFWWYGMLAKFGPKRIYAVPIPMIGPVYVRSRDSDMSTLRQVFRDRQYELKSPTHIARINAYYDAIIASGRTPLIIDAGANIGAAAIWFANKYENSKIIAIEPDPGNIKILRQNAAGRFEVYEAAVGGNEGFVSVVPKGLSWATQTARADQGLPVTTLDQVINKTGCDPFIVKIDIEGFEADLFSVNTGWIDVTPVIIIEPHDWMRSGTSRNFQAELGKRNYDILLCGENIIYVKR